MAKRGITRKNLYIFIVAYVLAFALFYAAYILFDVYMTDLEALEYIRYFYFEAVKFTLPFIAGALLIAIGKVNGTAYAMKHGWIFAMPSLVYLVPYYYLYYFYLVGDSLEALLFGLLNTLFDCLVFHGQAVLTYFAVRWLTDIFARKKRVKETDGLLLENKPFDLSSPVSLAFFTVIAIKFTVMLVLEAITTVDYLVDYSGAYEIGEILYILLSYVFLLLEFMLTQYLCFAVKGRVIKNASEDKKNEQNCN